MTSLYFASLRFLVIFLLVEQRRFAVGTLPIFVDDEARDEFSSPGKFSLTANFSVKLKVFMRIGFQSTLLIQLLLQRGQAPLKYLPSDKYRIKPLKYFLGAMRCTGANYC
jgi:hypothetical protein